MHRTVRLVVFFGLNPRARIRRAKIESTGNQRERRSCGHAQYAILDQNGKRQISGSRSALAAGGPCASMPRHRPPNGIPLTLVLRPKTFVFGQCVDFQWERGDRIFSINGFVSSQLYGQIATRIERQKRACWSTYPNRHRSYSQNRLTQPMRCRADHWQSRTEQRQMTNAAR